MNQIFKHCFTIVLFAAAFCSCNSNSERGATGRDSTAKRTDSSTLARGPLADTANFTTIRWEDSTFRDLKKIKRGDSAVIKYSFVNTGNKPLLITGVEPGCGCTVPEWPKEPVMPGKKGTIKAMFYTQVQAVATHVKQIFVNANTSPHTGHILTFKAEVTD